jgi:UDP-N-acetyl-D-mannosaminuronic acid transferase (WecB/TagA/CpsF family)
MQEHKCFVRFVRCKHLCKTVQKNPDFLYGYYSKNQKRHTTMVCLNGHKIITKQSNGELKNVIETRDQVLYDNEGHATNRRLLAEKTASKKTL